MAQIYAIPVVMKFLYTVYIYTYTVFYRCFFIGIVTFCKTSECMTAVKVI